MKFYHDIDLDANELQFAKMHRGTTASINLANTELGGNIKYDTSDHKLYYWKNTGGSAGTWVELATGTGGATYEIQTTTTTAAQQTYFQLYNATTSAVTDQLNFNGTANEVEVSSNSASTITWGLPDDVTIANSLTVGDGTGTSLTVNGDMIVTGTNTIINTATLDVEDTTITLNKNLTGAAPNSLRSGLDIERGSDPNVGLRWNDNTNKWEFTNDGTTWYQLLGDDSTGGQAVGYGAVLGDAGSCAANDHNEFISIKGATATGEDGIQVSVTNSSTTGSDLVAIGHKPLAAAGSGSLVGGRDTIDSAVTFAWGSTYTFMEYGHFDPNGHRVKTHRKQYTFPSAPITSDTFNRYQSMSFYTSGGAGLGSITAGGTNSTIHWKVADDSIAYVGGAGIANNSGNTADVVTLKSSIQNFTILVTHADVTSNFTNFATGATTYFQVNHALAAEDGVIVECWRARTNGTSDLNWFSRVNIQAYAGKVNNNLTGGTSALATTNSTSDLQNWITIQARKGYGFHTHNHLLVISAVNLDKNSGGGTSVSYA